MHIQYVCLFGQHVGVDGERGEDNDYMLHYQRYPRELSLHKYASHIWNNLGSLIG